MVHQRQRLTLGFEAGHHLAGVHAQLDDFQSDAAANGLLLLGQVNDPRAAFANLLKQLVTANAITRFAKEGERGRGA